MCSNIKYHLAIATALSLPPSSFCTTGDDVQPLVMTLRRDAQYQDMPDNKILVMQRRFESLKARRFSQPLKVFRPLNLHDILLSLMRH